jgi:RHS repeat-associated protein
MKNILNYIAALCLTGCSISVNAQPVGARQNIPVSDSPQNALMVPYPDLNNITGVTKFNFIKSIVPDEPVKNLPTGFFLHRQRTEYFDGLGRSLQTVDKRAHADDYDIVKQYVYDSLERERYQYLPFVVSAPVVSLAGKIKLDPKDKMREFYDNAGPDEQPYSKTNYDNAEEDQPVMGFSPGRSWVGSNRGSKYTYLYNLNNEVRKWNIDNIQSLLPSTTGYYNPGELYVTQAQDEDGNSTKEYKDKDGLTVLKKSILTTDSVTSVQHDGFACTYYVYDDQKRLRYIIPPKAVAAIDGSWSLTPVTELCFSYLYDRKGRLIEKKIPGKGVEFLVYDLRDRVCLTQDANLRNKGQWAFTLYDALNRPTVTGIATTIENRTQMQSGVDYSYQYYTPDAMMYHINNYSSLHQYPASLYLCKILSYNYYDDYEGVLGYQFVPGYISGNLPSGNHPEIEIPVLTTVNRGLLTRSRVRVNDPENPILDKWLTSVIYYDKKGRKIQTVSDNLLGGKDITTVVYYFQGMVWKAITYHSNPGAKAVPNATDGAIDEYVIAKTYTRNIGYGGNENVWKVDVKISDGPVFNLVNYDYDHLNRVTIKDLRAGLVLQEYNMRGFLNHIAAEDHSVFPYKAIFDERIRYDWGFASKLYNGNIAGIIWSGSDKKSHAYGYSYDKLDRLNHAEYRFKFGSSWSNSTKDYTASAITYDLNGNLQTMKQRGNSPPPGGPLDMDDLKYSYEANSNRLTRVEDAGEVIFGLPDFRNGASSFGEYTYDANGNMTADGNKKISSITYSYQNKPEIITTDSGTIAFTYDAAGNLLRKKINRSTGSTTFDYDGDFVYQDSVLQFISNEEGRARPIANDTTGYYTRFVYDYFIKDHLGNVRSTVTANPINADYMARHEIATANLEQLVFDNIPNVRDAKPGSINPNDGMAAHLDAANPNTRVGTAILLKVMPGDKFSVSANTYYEGEYQGGEEIGAGPLVESLLGALMGGGTYAGVPISELPDNIRTIKQILTNPAVPGALANLQLSDVATAPKAHLNYLFFNEEMELQPNLSGSIQVPTSNGIGWQAVDNSDVCNCVAGAPAGPGYILVYVDNQSIGKSVWFDDIHVEHYTSSVLEENHYYPFGLTVQTLDNQTIQTAQPYKFGTKALEKSFGLNWYDFIDRPYDMQRGQFTQMDRKADKYYEISPYAYSLNNPISFTDPDGKDPIHFSKMNFTGSWTDYLKTIPNAAINIGQGIVDITWNSADANIQAVQRGTWLQDMGNEINSIPGAAKQYVSNSIDYAVNTSVTDQLKDAFSPQGVETMLTFTGSIALSKLPEVNVGFSSRAAASEGGINIGPKVTTPYKRPSYSVTDAQRKSVQGKACVDCGEISKPMIADHKYPLVKEYYETGTIDKGKMRDVKSVQPQCATCSQKQGAEMSKYSKEMKAKLFKTNQQK